MGRDTNQNGELARLTAVKGERGWSTVIASCIGLAVGPSTLTILAFSAFIAPLEREFQWGIPAIALGASIISIMVVIVSPIQGFIVDKFGSRRVILWSIPPFGLSLCALYYLPNNLPVFYMAWVAIPVCGLGLWPVSYLRATAGWFEKRLGLALGIANAGIGLGTIFVPLLTAYLISNFGWREAYLVLGMIAFIAWPVVYLLFRDPAPAASGVQMTGETLKEASRLKPFWVMTVTFLLLGGCTAGLIVHQVRILIDAGIPAATATAVPAAFGLAVLIGRLATGWLLDRYSATAIMTAILAGGVLATALLASGPSITSAIFAAALIGLLTGAEFDVLSYIIPRYFGRLYLGQIYGAIFAVFQLSSAVGTLLLGMVRGAYGTYSPALWVMAGMSAAAALIFAQLGPYKYLSTDAAPEQVLAPAKGML